MMNEIQNNMEFVMDTDNTNDLDLVFFVFCYPYHLNQIKQQPIEV